MPASLKKLSHPRSHARAKLNSTRELFVLIIGIIISIFMRDLAGRTRAREADEGGAGPGEGDAGVL